MRFGICGSSEVRFEVSRMLPGFAGPPRCDLEHFEGCSESRRFLSLRAYRHVVAKDFALVLCLQGARVGAPGLSPRTRSCLKYAFDGC